MAAKGTKSNPWYVTEDGIELELAAIRPLVLDRFTREWGKRHPKPQPPVIILENGDEWRDANDSWYKECLAVWGGEQQQALSVFLLTFGVKTAPPQDWLPLYDEDDATPRYMWLSEILAERDLEGLIEAIVGVDNPTPDGIEEAEENFPQAGGESALNNTVLDTEHKHT